MKKAKTIKVLNTLIEINNFRTEAYKIASRVSDEQDLLALFAHLVQTSHKCSKELEVEIYKLGGQPSEGTSAISKFYRVWIDINSGFSLNDRKAILNSFEFGENLTVETYKKVLEVDSEYLTLNQHRMVQSQFALIKADYKKVKSLSNTFMVIA